MTTDNNLETTKVYRDHTIELNTHNWEFTVTGKEFDDNKYKITFQSYKAARDEIDKRANESQKLAAKNITMNLVAIDENGEQVEISRISRATGEVNGLSTRYFYPGVEWLREALQRRNKLRSEIKTIEEAAQPFQINRSVGWGGRLDAERYGGYIEKLKKEFAEKTQAARERGKLAEASVQPLAEAQKS